MALKNIARVATRTNKTYKFPGTANFNRVSIPAVQQFHSLESQHPKCSIQYVSSRSLSSYMHERGPRRPSARFVDEEEEEEEEYDVDENDLEELRRSHRDEARQQHVEEGVKFSDFPLDPKLLEKLDQLGYKEPFEIQAKTLEHTLSGRDVIGKALTGSGKTLAFSVPIVQKLMESGRRGKTNSPKAIVISPTRELCMQIYRSVQELDPTIRCGAFYGGDSIQKQEKQIYRGIDVVCATPGRLRDHLERGNINLRELSFLCLDEADELLTPNFKEQIEDVLQNSPEGKQMMLFSATMPHNIKHITKRYMSDPVHVDISSNQKYSTPESVKHLCIKAPASQHLYLVKSLVNEHNPERCIIFMETKVKTRQAAQTLKKMGVKAEAISSDLTQNRREHIMAAFRKGMVKSLVATDVAARGLDIPEVDLVIQVGPPRNGSDYYIHRSGRTGRGGRPGLAVMLHTGDSTDRQAIYEIERLVDMKHAGAPNLGELQQGMAQDIVRKLNYVRPEEIKTFLPVAQGLDMTDDKGTLLMAAALSMLVKGDPSSSNDFSKGNKFDRNRNSNNRFSKPKRNFSRSLKEPNYDDW